MSRKVVRLTVDHLAELPGPCCTCLFWELDPVRRGRVHGREAAAAEKEAWLSEVLREWGSCGRVVLVDDRPVGYVVYVPAAFAPGADGFPTAPVSSDAVLLTTAYVDPLHAGGGLGRMLVQGMAGDLIRRGGIRAVEAFGTTTPRRGSCLVSTEFLGGVGFKTHRPHPRTPRMRMELRSALTWRDEVEAALERLIGVVRPAPAPASERSHRSLGEPGER
ncbi:GNAT family N-acetyltransferase [Nocardioides psychrotolerans]|uniref:Acetyltransferase (GNAT) family protein n=1 Tax=Nocardioides psychrotolerans TaxID=1005945 RepID=A0A1I3GE55_9ACTN|nr:GNAT family N-acetyltransferase [Nocardioides psychrotolerans]GEP39926.1 GNAT family N-acetyltransferase [Nocardioides psychrotolerans]SFI21788.1 Acetyltransferase (GNAT) family protein [Nocardioides psychrotolerans]